MAIFEREFRLTVNDIKTTTSCSNLSILRFFEITAGSHSDTVGFGISDIERTRYSWILLGWKLKVLRYPVYNEKITIKTWARDTDKITTYRDYEGYDEQGNLFAIATSKWALIDIDKGLTKIPQELIDGYEREDKCVFDDRKLKRITPPASENPPFFYKVLRRDVDINNHVHNLNYLTFAEEALPEELYSKTFTELEIMFKNEAKLYDNLALTVSEDDFSYYVNIENAQTKQLHAVVKFNK